MFEISVKTILDVIRFPELPRKFTDQNWRFFIFIMVVHFTGRWGGKPFFMRKAN